jgi:hypothetical protein
MVDKKGNLYQFKKAGGVTGGEPPMESDFEKYLEARFTNIDDKISGHLANIDQRFDRIESDIREIRGEQKTLLYWIIGNAIVIIAVFIALFTYHTQVMQSQMQVFSDYVKAVTQPTSKAPFPSK